MNARMKKHRCLVFSFSLIMIVQCYGQDDEISKERSKEIVLSIIAGISPAAKRGLDYGAGFGVQAGANLNKFYVGGVLARHQGSKTRINYGRVSNLGINGGAQDYKWTCLFFAADAGYRLTLLKAGNISAVLMPYISSGLGIINMKTSGVYGEGDNVVDKKIRFGGGAAYQVSFGDRFSVGLNYRVYAPVDAAFDFGSRRNEIPHGFSTGLYYYAFFSEFSYRL